MKFVANSVELQRTLSKLGGVVPVKSTMPILENLLFELVNDALTITATDIAISLTLTIQVKGEEDGKIAIPAKRLMDTIRSLPDTSAVFVIDTTSSKIRINTENGEYALTGEQAKEFPSVPAFKGSQEIEFDAGVLRRIIHRTAFAVSTDELRPAMMGVLFQGSGSHVCVVATDGHRLVKLVRLLPTGVTLVKDIVIPAKALLIAAKSIEEGICTLSASETHVRVAFGKAFLVSRLIDESYPNYESVIPKDNDKVMTVDRDATMTSIRRVALYANATTHQVRFDVSSDSLRLSAQDLDFGGEAKETLHCTTEGGGIEIGFNATYLVDILSHLESTYVTFRFSTPTRAAVIAPAEAEENEDITMLVMPVRLNA
jgi:DNA polymerase-3 subunit beta